MLSSEAFHFGRHALMEVLNIKMPEVHKVADSTVAANDSKGGYNWNSLIASR